jgi:hypothetical protein
MGIVSILEDVEGFPDEGLAESQGVFMSEDAITDTIVTNNFAAGPVSIHTA